jgi:hypothetical protein
MRFTLLAALCLASLAASAAADETPLRHFDFLAGHCWRGEYEETKAADTHCYTWVFGRKHLRDVHVVSSDGPDYRGETIYSVDSASGGVIFRYWNSLGGVSDGRILFEDGVIRAPGEKYTGDGGVTREFRSAMRRLDEFRYEAVTEELIDGRWGNAERIVFTRTDAKSKELKSKAPAT